MLKLLVLWTDGWCAWLLFFPSTRGGVLEIFLEFQRLAAVHPPCVRSSGQSLKAFLRYSASKELRLLKVQVSPCLWFSGKQRGLVLISRLGLSQETDVPCGQRIWFISRKKNNLIYSSLGWKWYIRDMFRKNSLVKKKKKKKKVSKEKKGWLINKYWFFSIFTPTKEQRIIQIASFVKNLYKYSYPTNFTRKIGYRFDMDSESNKWNH